MNRFLKRVVKVCDRVSGFGGFLAGAMMCLGVGLIASEIVFRAVFNQTLYVADEYAGYLMAMLTFASLGYTLREGGHIRMTFLRSAVVGRARVVLDMACFLVGFCFCLTLCYFTALLFWDSFVTGSRSMQISRTYLAIPQAFLPFGALIFSLQFLAEFFRRILVLRGDTEGISLVEDFGDLGR